MQIMEDMLRHRHDGLTIAEIAAATGSSTGTVSHILERTRTAETGWPLPDGMSRSKLQDTLWPQRRAKCSEDRLEPDLAAAAAKLTRRLERREPRAARLELWEDHCLDAAAASMKLPGKNPSAIFRKGSATAKLPGKGNQPFRIITTSNQSATNRPITVKILCNPTPGSRRAVFLTPDNACAPKHVPHMGQEIGFQLRQLTKEHLISYFVNSTEKEETHDR